MNVSRFGAAVCLVAMLAGCGGDGGSSGVATGGGTPSTGGIGGGTTGTATGDGTCSLRDRQDWVAGQMREWYLFPETLPTALDPAGYTNIDDYLDALTATARSQRRDRYFTYLTSIAEENAYYDSGSSAGFGFRLATDASARRLFVTEAFEGTAALSAEIDRGSEILAIGTSASTLRDVGAIVATEGTEGLNTALGPSAVGTARAFRVADAAGTRVVTIAKTDYTLTPVSSRYGAKIIDEGGQRYGYVNLRTFITTAGPALRDAFAQFRAAGITRVVVDLRYNGGGLVSIAELMGDLLGGNRAASDVFSYTTFRPEKSAEDSRHLFTAQPQAIAPTRIAFIGTGGTASASEIVINAFTPYLHGNAALVGTNTFGKPVGQIAIDRSQCDDRLRVIAFAEQNAARQGNYYDGLATTVEASCQAGDDIGYPLGDPREASIRAAIDFLAGKSCTRIAAGEVTAQSVSASGNGRRVLLTPDKPDTVQREVPGAF
ncbi:MAG TPA: S41 family peptidase [Sphingomonas sp.]|jgi:C-terminal processing protease CtpA/Prc|nr:S41 family peptidase [Sphingomonas sp.]